MSLEADGCDGLVMKATMAPVILKQATVELSLEPYSNNERISLGAIPYDGINENQGCFECNQEHATKDRLETFGCVRPMRPVMVT